MGNKMSTSIKINYEDIQYILKNPEGHLLINTLSETEQECLILNTMNIKNEENIINSCIKNGRKDIKIIIYGKNCNDEKTINKYNQLIKYEGSFSTVIRPGSKEGFSKVFGDNMVWDGSAVFYSFTCEVEGEQILLAGSLQKDAYNGVLKINLDNF